MSDDLRRVVELTASAPDSLGRQQMRAVRLQERYGEWPTTFFADMPRRQVMEAACDPHLAEAESLFRSVLLGDITPGQSAVAGYQLALLLHRQGRLEEARALYEEAVRTCQLSPELTESSSWALGYASWRLGELLMDENRQLATGFFADSRHLAHERSDEVLMAANELACERFGLRTCGRDAEE